MGSWSLRHLAFRRVWTRLGWILSAMGVFAFAITLLVLGIQLPELTRIDDRQLREGLLHALQQLLPYVTSFATIGIIWLNHHAKPSTSSLCFVMRPPIDLICLRSLVLFGCQAHAEGILERLRNGSMPCDGACSKVCRWDPTKTDAQYARLR